ncbi:MAG: cupin domain-containing protein [Rhodospirillales bacterium]|nr:cupin domain-containing protein [Rhodospirillales bacterium]
MKAEDVIRNLDLVPHPEGGHFRETFRDPGGTLARGHSTAIYYLLRSGERSHWHRVDAAEIWHWYAGDALLLSLSSEDASILDHTLGPDLAAGQRPQFAVPAGAWQSARSLGDWTLVGCTVAPGFSFDGFEIAPEGWRPG